jgi:hypothetical protein
MIRSNDPTAVPDGKNAIKFCDGSQWRHSRLMRATRDNCACGTGIALSLIDSGFHRRLPRDSDGPSRHHCHGLNRHRFAGLTAPALAAPSIFPSCACGADWPVKPVRVVVPFTPGGSTDITARLIGNRLQEVWGQSVVIENKPGAGGNIAADMVAHADPDGYTIFISGPAWPPTGSCIHS